jgi:addiction module HigA family antidote
MKKLRNIHPGEILLKEFLEPLKISSYHLAKDLSIPQTRISSIVNGTRRITADTALRLSLFFGNSAKFWLSLQDDYDIEEELRLKKKDFGLIKRCDLGNLKTFGFIPTT